MSKPTIREIDELWGPATPQFAYQLAARLARMIDGIPPGDPVRTHAEMRLDELQRLGLGTTKGEAPAH